MRIVVATKNTDPIDLTASLIKARYKQVSNERCLIEWIVESSASITNYCELAQIASRFKGFDINVKWQKEVPELNPNKAEIISLLKNILKYIDVSKGMVRIQHGAIAIERDKLVVCCRYFGWEHGRLLLCDNKKHPIFYYVDESDSQKLSLQGSMNLCLMYNYGELAHLPWYCMDSPIYPFEIEEVITPPEGCSACRYDAKRTRLIPSGYSIYDYSLAENRTISTIEKWLYENGSIIFSRQMDGTKCAKNLLQKIAGKIKNNIKDKGFYTCLCSLNKNTVLPEEIIMKLLEIWALSQVMISYERGYLNEIRSMELADNNDKLKICSEEILNLLLNSADDCFEKISSEDKSVRNSIIGKDKPFGILAKMAFNNSVQFFNRLFYELYYINKATLPNLLKCYSHDHIDSDFFDILERKRTSCVSHIVRGSIFEFEAYTSIKSRIGKTC